jgi:nitric oxide dioxygenase
MPVGEVLLWTLEHGLGSDWTPELKSAWSAAYATLANFMIAEAYGREAAAMRTAGATLLETSPD